MFTSPAELKIIIGCILRGTSTLTLHIQQNGNGSEIGGGGGLGACEANGISCGVLRKASGLGSSSDTGF